MNWKGHYCIAPGCVEVTVTALIASLAIADSCFRVAWYTSRPWFGITAIQSYATVCSGQMLIDGHTDVLPVLHLPFQQSFSRLYKPCFDLQQPYQMCQITFPMFHDSVSQCLMLGPSCSPTKHFLSAPGMTMGMQSFSDQSWEPEDRPVFPGMQPIRKEMEGTQDVLSTVSHSTLQWRGQSLAGWPELVEELFTGIFSTSPLPLLNMPTWWSGIPYSGFPLHLSYHCFLVSCQIWPDLSSTPGYV